MAPQVDTATAEALRHMARTKQRRTYLPYTFPAFDSHYTHAKAQSTAACTGICTDITSYADHFLVAVSNLPYYCKSQKVHWWQKETHVGR